ncbi:Tim44 domain-containing protein [Neptuniibacter sp. 2_MG-2023]|uniref:Tim44 domain-containing protein n=1 Tax=Neptuniibacter sp. 2_MG-2023 TaxID=3062671 RepID=UPI0026E3339F|nr:TIM44-like domain-containing protein [Neptuniibacter sp. 2_MG-2023]MDO6512811.1 TIM44-like domain-containing protein [Neptuniibacter sp. 2_MG-2023]
MRTFFITLMAVFFITLPLAETADAKRLGGGSSFGKSFFSSKKTQPAPTQKQPSATNTQNKAAGTAPKRSGFGGMMAGLLAGGIFGALLFGGAFDGIQFMDLLLIAGVIFIIYKIMSMRKQSRPQQSAYTNGAQQYEINPHTQPMEREARAEPEAEFKPMPSFSSGWGESNEIKVPSWFNQTAFLAGAQEHFVNLQKAWDANNWDEIKTYTSPEMFALLKAERAKSPEQQTTEVVSVMAEVANFIEEKDEAIVSINFYGWLKENTDEATEFNETWHLSRDMRQPDADWFIVGIQQN